MRQAEELSTTVAPCSTKRFAHAREVPPPAEKRAMSKPSIVSSARTRTGSSAPSSVRPAERSEANGTTELAGNPRRRSRRSRSVPTAPVAPTTATRMRALPQPGRPRSGPQGPTKSGPSCGELPERALGLDGAVARQLEGGMQGAHGVRHAVAADDAGDLDRRRRDHLDVDALPAERGEDLRGDARVRLHARADDRDLAHVL